MAKQKAKQTHSMESLNTNSWTLPHIIKKTKTEQNQKKKKKSKKPHHNKNKQQWWQWWEWKACWSHPLGFAGGTTLQKKKKKLD